MEVRAVEVRERRQEDLEQLVVVAGRVRAADGYPVHLPDGDLLRFLSRPEPVAAWVGWIDDRIVGHVALNGETSPAVMEQAGHVTGGVRVGFVARLLVDPSARRLGIGGTLLDVATQEAGRRGFLPMLDVVDDPDGSAAISLYRQRGWVEVGRARFEPKGGSAIDELVFRAPVGSNPES